MNSREAHKILIAQCEVAVAARSACAIVTDFDSIFRSELTEAASVTAIRALRMQKDQLQVGHTTHPSDSGRQASERPPCCHKESLAAYL
jgi:hypothetical protein